VDGESSYTVLEYFLPDPGTPLVIFVVKLFVFFRLGLSVVFICVYMDSFKLGTATAEVLIPPKIGRLMGVAVCYKLYMYLILHREQ